MRGVDPDTITAARRLRRNATDAERRVWYRLRARSLAGRKFLRQEPIGAYVVDFVCREERLVVEVDGGQHADSKSDAIRDQWLRNNGYRVLRFWNNDVLTNTEGVLATIAEALCAGAAGLSTGSPTEPNGSLSSAPLMPSSFDPVGQHGETRHDASPSPRLRGEGRGEGPAVPATSER
jgi:very-short-patch-repair endonuclease